MPHSQDAFARVLRSRRLPARRVLALAAVVLTAGQLSSLPALAGTKGKATATTSTTAQVTSTTASTVAPTSSTTSSSTTTSAAPATTTTTTAPAPAAKRFDVGFNEQWDTQASLDTFLTPSDLSTLKSLGTTVVRLPIKCHTVGACSYTARHDDTIDFRTVTTWDFTKLDAAVSELLSAGITPVIAPTPGSNMHAPGYIVDDNVNASLQAYVQAIVSHLAARFGPLPYSLFETEQSTSLITGADGVKRYRYLSATGFPASFVAGLSALYGGSIANLNAVHGTTYASFTDVPVPDLGSSASVPSTVFDAPATYDVRRVIARLSADRYSSLGDLVHRLSPGSEWWGPTIQIQSMHDARQTHGTTTLTPVGPTVSDLAAEPGIDVVSVDGYRDNAPWVQAAELRTAAKLAAKGGKQLAITEVGGANALDFQNAVDSVRRGGSNLRAMLVWEAKDQVADTALYGVLDVNGVVKAGYGLPVSSLFTDLTADLQRRQYVTGAEAVYYPEWALQVVQNGKLTTSKTLTAMADLMASGRSVEPVNDADVVAGGWNRLTVYSLYMGEQARAALAASTKPVVAYQYAAHRTGFKAGKAVDALIWPARNGFSVSATETTPRVAETVQLAGASVAVSASVSLAGWPFVHVTATGSDTVIGSHASGSVLAVRSPSGSAWIDEYVGGPSIGGLYG